MNQYAVNVIGKDVTICMISYLQLFQNTSKPIMTLIDKKFR